MGYSPRPKLCPKCKRVRNQYPASGPRGHRVRGKWCSKCVRLHGDPPDTSYKPTAEDLALRAMLKRERKMSLARQARHA